MKITYIHHSSFSVELDNTILLFDYFKGNLPSFDKNKKLYVFSSHSHHDHFDESIFNIEKTHPSQSYRQPMRTGNRPYRSLRHRTLYI